MTEPTGAGMRPEIPTVTVLGVPVAVLDTATALAEVRRLLAGPRPAILAYANAHALNVATVDGRFRDVLRRVDLLLNDGSGLALAGRLRGTRFPDNLNGTDFTPRVLAEATAAGLSVFLLGARPGVAEEAAQRLVARMPGLRVAGCAHGYFTPAEQPALLDRIRASGAGVVVAAMGNPRQELWLAEHLPATGARLGVAVGAFLDFAAARVPRAPAWMRAAGVEWAYRLGREPRRLFHRYVVGNPAFLYRVARERVGGR